MSGAKLLYDGDCGFCRWSAGKILAWDRHRRLHPVPLQSPEAQRLLDGMSEQERLASWHLVTAGGRIYSAGAGVEPLARLLPCGAPVALAARTFPKSTDRIYRWVARNRDRLGRRVGDKACSVDPVRARGRVR